jgi:hypothetical protein
MSFRKISSLGRRDMRKRYERMREVVGNKEKAWFSEVEIIISDACASYV